MRLCPCCSPQVYLAPAVSGMLPPAPPHDAGSTRRSEHLVSGLCSVPHLKVAGVGVSKCCTELLLLALRIGLFYGHLLSAEVGAMYPRHPLHIINRLAHGSSPPSADSPGGLQSLEQKIRRKAPAAVQQLLSHEATLEGMRRRSQVPLLVLPNTRACDADYPTHHARVSGQPRVPCSLHPGTTQSALWMSCIMPTSYSHRPQAIDIQPGAATRRDSAMLRRLRARLRQGPSRAQQPSRHSRHRPSPLS